MSFYRRGLRGWPRREEGELEAPPETPLHRGRFGPRAVALAAALAFALLLLSTRWTRLAAVATWLALAAVLSRPDRRAVPTGLVLAALLAGGAFAFTFIGGLGLEEALRRASRAALLVLVATWLRAAAGAEGLREVSRRALGRLRALPSAPEAARVLERIGSEGRLTAAGRSLLESLEGVRRRPVPLMDAVLRWVAGEAASYRPGAAAPPLTLGAGVGDLALLAAALAPVAALAA